MIDQIQEDCQVPGLSPEFIKLVDTFLLSRDDQCREDHECTYPCFPGICFQYSAEYSKSLTAVPHNCHRNNGREIVNPVPVMIINFG